MRPAALPKGGTMLTPVHDHHTPVSPASAPVRIIERAALIPFAPNDALPKLMRADSARRFASLRAALREANRANGDARRPQTEPGSHGHAAARLKHATMYYEQHVLAWYALGRITEARSAREAIARCRQAVAAESIRDASRRPRHGAHRRRELQPA
jgi:hypothetical protein